MRYFLETENAVETENRREILYQKSRLLPKAPGVYLMYSKSKTLLYVGKSKTLQNRVSSYFQAGAKLPKTEKLVSQIWDFETIATATEQEALLLENELIKRHKPKYNILLKDDKNYPYLYLSLGDEYPRLRLERKRRDKDKGLYFGPYSSSKTVYGVIRAANEIFRLPRCKKRFPEEIGKARPCLYYDMGKCMGLCTGKISKEDYRKTIDDLILFLRHDHKNLERDLKERMTAAAARQAFEEAATYRDAIRALDSLDKKQYVLADASVSADAFAYYPHEVLPTVAKLAVRQGRLIDAVYFTFSPSQIVDAESFYSLLYDHYSHADDLPRKLYLDRELFLESDTLLSELLHTRAGHKVEILCPKREMGAHLLALAKENAQKECLHRLKTRARTARVLEELQELLNLPAPPERVESYDISNSGADVITGGMVVYENHRFLKSAYRSFSIDQDKPDDYAATRQMIARRMAHKNEDGWRAPDLILLDGGMTHVSEVKKELSALGLSEIPVFGMVKDGHHRTRALTDEAHEISIAKNGSIYGFLYQLQEEVHRFALSRMDQRRRKQMLSSRLTEIRGIGERKALNLITTFGSVDAIAKASLDELCAVKGISRADAQTIKEFFEKD